MYSQNNLKYNTQLTCNTSQHSNNFDLNFKLSALNVGQKFQMITKITAPNTSSEVINFNHNNQRGIEIDCFPMIKGFEVSKLEFIRIEGLPNGLYGTSNLKDRFATGGTKYCLYIDGTPTKKGIYEVRFIVKAYPKLGSFSTPVTPTCTIRGIKITVN